ncbi:hypothetical protein [Jatrophihabitans sp.]|uniref:hypothetical protein n=1 Tax=Jatrophihabitans sp. TaxID=1932789 RepID=UPI002B574611|nr:hypothetical protein [Jatrophihabitans sp.]
MTQPPVTCQVCGRGPDPATEGDPPLAWVLDTEAGRRRWTCPGCARENVRAIEAKLDSQWW